MLVNASMCSSSAWHVLARILIARVSPMERNSWGDFGWPLPYFYHTAAIRPAIPMQRSTFSRHEEQTPDTCSSYSLDDELVGETDSLDGSLISREARSRTIV